MDKTFNQIITLLEIADEYCSQLEAKELIGDDIRTILMDLIEQIKSAQ